MAEGGEVVSFQQLQEELKPVQALLDTVSALQPQSEEASAEERRQLAAAGRDQLLDEMVELLLDLREHLTRAAEAARQTRGEMPFAKRGGLVERLRAKPLVQADGIVTTLMKGYDLCRAELDKALSQYGVRPIECVGGQFDAARMKAVDTDETGNATDGTVTAICRQGYVRHGRVYRLAEVKVARRPSRKLTHSSSRVPIRYSYSRAWDSR